jgi:flagellar hook-associated protein 3 FlgL
MRVTSSIYYDSLYGNNNLKINKELFDVNRQIASGLKIQYAQDDVSTFTETMRLDNEMVTLGQIKQSTDSGYKVSNQSDVVLNEFETSMNRMRTLLVQAANDTNDVTSRDAIAHELRGVEKNLKALANTSINGQYLFSGSAVDIKPISDDGTYNGNDIAMNAFLGSRNEQQYNLTGANLFLGEEVLVKREISTNVVNTNLLKNYPQLQASTSDQDNLSASSNIRNLMGDIDNQTTPANNYHFYLRGTKSDGTAFNKKITMQDTDKVDELLTQIGNFYGNTPNLKIVNVSLNDVGQIIVEDKQSGSSKLDFHMVGAVDFDTTDNGGNDDANVINIDNLDVGETNFDKIINGTSTAANKNLFVKEFTKSGLNPATGAATNIEGLIYDRTEFSKNGSKLSSNVPQVAKSNNAFATPSTKISEVADLSQGNSETLDGTVMKLVGTDVNGVAYDVNINFNNTANGGSTFTDNVSGLSYNIYDMNPAGRTAVDADKMTYQQLMDVMNMVVTDTLPATSPGTADEYDTAIRDSKGRGDTYLSYDGKIQFGDMLSKDTKASISLYDSNSGKFGGDSSVMTLNTNNSLSIRDPKTDFFKTIDEMISAVENNKIYPDADSGDVRSVGIENAIKMIDDLQDHVLRAHAEVGAQSNTLTKSLERTQILEISTMSLRSSVVDTDLAEASLKLQQLSLNYEAMLSTVGKISKLSLVNYL